MAPTSQAVCCPISLFQAAWAKQAELQTLLPAERIKQAPIPNPDNSPYPYATVSVNLTQRKRTSSWASYNAPTTINIYTKEQPEGRNIARLVRASMPVWDEADECYSICCADGIGGDLTGQQQDSGAWLFAVTGSFQFSEKAP